MAMARAAGRGGGMVGVENELRPTGTSDGSQTLYFRLSI
jgi:hypothetical protein